MTAMTKPTALLHLLPLLAMAVALASPADAAACRGQLSRHQCTAPGSCAASRTKTVGYGAGLCADGEVCCLSGRGDRCAALGGRCGLASLCAGGKAPSKCPGNGDVTCCLAGAGGRHFKELADERNDEPPVTTPTEDVPPGATETEAEQEKNFVGPPMPLCFPVEESSFKKTGRTSFGSVRPWDEPEPFTRCHCGQDIYVKNDGRTLAMAHGFVRKIRTFKKCNDLQTYAVLVWHPDIQRTINYGEMNGIHLLVKDGQEVQRGQLLGLAGLCGMLHLETYDDDRTRTIQWKLKSPSHSKQACKKEKPPAHVLSSWPLVSDLLAKKAFCTAHERRNPCEGEGPAGECVGKGFCKVKGAKNGGRCTNYGRPVNNDVVCCHT